MYASVILDVPEPDPWLIALSEDRIMAANASEGNTRFECYDFAGEPTGSFDIPMIAECFAILPDGGIVVCGASELIIFRDGEPTQLCGDVASLFESVEAEAEIASGRFAIQKILIDGESDICLFSKTSLVCIGQDGAKRCEIAVGNLTDAAVSEGGIVVSCYDKSGKWTCRRVDKSAGRLSGTMELPTGLDLRSCTLKSGGGYEIYIDDGDLLWGYDDGELVPLCSWINSDIIRSAVRDIWIIDPEHILAVYNEQVTGTEWALRLMLLTRIPDEEVPERYLIRVAGSGASASLRAAIVRFNRENKGYRAVLEDYSRFNTYEDYERGNILLRNEIISGRIPDVMVFTNEDERYSYKEGYIKSGMFADLYDFMADDSPIRRGDLIEAIDEKLRRDGALYELVSSFSIETIASVEGDAASLDGFVGQMGRLTENRLWTADAGLLLCDILKLNLDGFTNSGRRAEFDSDSFRRLLSEVKRVSELPRGEEAYQYVQILNPEGYVSFSNCFGGEGRLCGYPCPEGQSGASLRINESFAIYKRSAVRDGAWELICEAALGRNLDLGFSGVRGLLEADVSRLVGNRYQISPGGAVSSLLSGREPDPGKRLYVFDESERDKLMNLLEGAAVGEDYFSPVLTIIREETSYYFSGAKSLDETVSLIQDRVGTYLAEIN